MLPMSSVVGREHFKIRDPKKSETAVAGCLAAHDCHGEPSYRRYDEGEQYCVRDFAPNEHATNMALIQEQRH